MYAGDRGEYARGRTLSGALFTCRGFVLVVGYVHVHAPTAAAAIALRLSAARLLAAAPHSRPRGKRRGASESDARASTPSRTDSAAAHALHS